jgi:hypothetical protein
MPYAARSEEYVCQFRIRGIWRTPRIYRGRLGGCATVCAAAVRAPWRPSAA